MNVFWEALEICKAGKVQLSGVQLYKDGFRSFKEHWYRKRSTLQEFEVPMPTTGLNYMLVRGDAKFKPYPFLPTEYLHRSEHLVTDIQQTLKRKTSGKRNPSHSPTLGTTNCDDPGVIAGSDVEAGTQLIRERALLVASSDNPLLLQRSKGYKVCEFCCDIVQLQQKNTASCEKCLATYCTEFSRDIASATYHKALCGEDFSWLYDVDKVGQTQRRKDSGETKGRAKRFVVTSHRSLCSRRPPSFRVTHNRQSDFTVQARGTSRMVTFWEL